MYEKIFSKTLMMLASINWVISDSLGTMTLLVHVGAAVLR